MYKIKLQEGLYVGCDTPEEAIAIVRWFHSPEPLNQAEQSFVKARCGRPYINRGAIPKHELNCRQCQYVMQREAEDASPA